MLVLTTAFNLYLIALGKKQEDSKREEMSKMSREKEYLDEVMQDVVWGKDIRLFGLMSWLTRWYDKVTGSRRGLQTGGAAAVYQIRFAGCCNISASGSCYLWIFDLGSNDGQISSG